MKKTSPFSQITVGIFLLYLLCFATACEEECCLQSPYIIGFMDIKVSPQDQKEADEINKSRIRQLLKPIKEKYVPTDAAQMCPISLVLHPLYFDNGAKHSIHKFIEPLPGESYCALDAVEKSQRKTTFNSYLINYDAFRKTALNPERKTTLASYKEIWSSIDLLTDRIIQSNSDSVIVIYQSDFLEFHSPKNIEAGNLLFVKKEGNYYIYDHKAIQEAYDAIKGDQPSVIQQSIKKNKEKLAGWINSGKNLKVFLVEAPSFYEVKRDVARNGVTINKVDFFKMILQKMGIEKVELVLGIEELRHKL